MTTQRPRARPPRGTRRVPRTSTPRPSAPAGETERMARRPKATPPQRGPDGRFLPGNRVARTHGLTGAADPATSVAWPPPEDFLAAAIVDDGG